MRFFQELERFVLLYAKLVALLGGLVLLALMLMTSASVIGRALTPLGLNQIEGDFELVELGLGFAVFCFLPWAQLVRAHARVDLFAQRMSLRFRLLVDLLTDVLMAAAALLITWRLWLGLLDKKAYFETTFILQLPTWYAYAAAMVGAISFCIVSLFCLLRSGVLCAQQLDPSHVANPNKKRNE